MSWRTGADESIRDLHALCDRNAACMMHSSVDRMCVPCRAAQIIALQQSQIRRFQLGELVHNGTSVVMGPVPGEGSSPPEINIVLDSQRDRSNPEIVPQIA